MSFHCSEPESILNWYQGKCIFITGGTGFLGKCLTEKLLRSCNVRKVYLLIRNRRGLDSSLRLEKILSSQLFDHIRETQPEVLQKLVTINGDITQEGLGISDEDEAKIIENVSVIFHVAATINFQERLRRAIDINVLGTKRVIALSRKLKDLKALVHVSTVYANSHATVVDEKFYPLSITPSKLIQMTNWFNDDFVDFITTKLIAPRPNTYTFTKAITEQVLAEDCVGMPLAIVRPSLVCASMREPSEGWLDNVVGFNGIVVGLRQGIFRTLYGKSGIYVDLIPVDFTINLMMVAACNADKQFCRFSDGIQIYSSSTSSQNPLSIERLSRLLRKSTFKIPPKNPTWYPDGYISTSKVLHTVNDLYATITFNFPIYLYETIMKILGKKTLKIHKLLVQLPIVAKYFTVRQFIFNNENVQKLWSCLTAEDREIFLFDVSQINWEEYIENYHKGCKKYIMKEDMTQMSKSKKTVFKFHVLHRAVQILFGYTAWCLASSETAMSMYGNSMNLLSHYSTVIPGLCFASAEEQQ